MAKTTQTSTKFLTVTGTVRRIINEFSDGTKVVSIIPDNDNNRCTSVLVNGKEIVPNRHYEFFGCIQMYNNTPELKTFSLRETLPRKSYQLSTFLSHGKLPGITKKNAEKLIERYNSKAIDILENEPEKLREYTESEEDYRVLLKALERYTQKDDMTIVETLGGAGVPMYVIKALLEKCGGGLEEILKTNPYSLIRDTRGYSFAMADRLAKGYSIPNDSVERIIAGLSFVLSDAAMSGDCYMKLNTLVQKAASDKFLNLDEKRVKQVLYDYVEKNGAEGDVVFEGGRVYTRKMYQDENYIADSIFSIVGNSHPESAAVISPRDLETINGIQYAPEQATAISMAQRNDFLIITGGPGTGKTTTLKGVVQSLSMLGKKEIDVLAPTGLAANRAKESVGGLNGLSFSTIHRALEYKGTTFTRNEKFPIEADVIIVDESSMMDVSLTAALLKARKPGGKVIFVGDVDQLPSVGPGLVLRDLIESDELPVVRLSRVYRLREDSPIVSAAADINEGKNPQFLKDEIESNEFCFIRKDEKQVQNEIVRLITKDIPDKTGLLPSDIQVMSPFKRGTKRNPNDPLSTSELNKRLQEVLNPHGESIKWNGTTFRVGDRVMNLVNNYSICKDGIINGQQGTIVSVTSGNPPAVSVQFKGLNYVVPIEGYDLDNIDLAYAITVHKSQGSEYPAVIMPMVKSHEWFNTRSLFYTWLTRGKNMAVCIGSESVMESAVKNNSPVKRLTTLRERIKNRFLGEEIEETVQDEPKKEDTVKEEAKTEGFKAKRLSFEDASEAALSQYSTILDFDDKKVFEQPVICQNIDGKVYKGIVQLLLLCELHN